MVNGIRQLLDKWAVGDPFSEEGKLGREQLFALQPKPAGQLNVADTTALFGAPVGGDFQPVGSAPMDVEPPSFAAQAKAAAPLLPPAPLSAQAQEPGGVPHAC